MPQMQHFSVELLSFYYSQTGCRKEGEEMTGFEKLNADELVAFIEKNLPIYNTLLNSGLDSAADRIKGMVLDANAELVRKLGC